ncbi:MAG: dihydroorotase [Gammaproteobacteria bacterium]
MKGPRIAISGARLIDPANGVDQQLSVYIANGVIAAVGKRPDGFHADREIRAPGQIVCPGFIDLCARIREPGQEHKATIASETAAAVAGGFTTLCCPPDTQPVIDTPAVAEMIRDRADRIGKARILPVGALTRGLRGEELSEMRALKKAGCVAASNALTPIANTLVLRRALEYAASFDMLVMVRPEDPWLRNHGVVHEGLVATRLGLPGIPEAAETVAVAQVLALLKQSGARVHFSQLSSAGAVEMLAWAREIGLPVTGDVSAHQLCLTETALGDYDSLYHVIPPFRTESDRAALAKGLKSGVLAAICSDHQPHEEGAKLEAFSSTEPGISSLETVLPLTLGLVSMGQLDLLRAIDGLTHGPATVLGLSSGQIKSGSVADLCVFDPEALWQANARNWLSRGLNSPYFGTQMKGRVTCTLVAGRIVYESTNQS